MVTSGWPPPHSPIDMHMSLSSLLFSVLAASLLLFASSQEDGTDSCSEINQLQLDSARERWEASGIVSYYYEFDQICLCYPPGPFAIEVRNCSVYSVDLLLEEMPDGEMFDPPSINQVSTIDELLTRLQQILDGCPEQPPNSYSASFDEKYGYPTVVNIDPEELVVDEEIVYSVSNFSVIESNDAGCGIIPVETSVPSSGPSMDPFDTNAPSLGPSMESVDTNAPSAEPTNNIDTTSSSSDHLYGATALVSTLAIIIIMRCFGGN